MSAANGVNRRHVQAYLAAGAAMAGLDAIWLTATNTALYRATLGPILAPGFRLAPAISFYLIYLLGVVVFAVSPALPAGRWRGAAGRGALLGLVCYGTYDLTNQATLSVWSTRLTLIDLSWGVILTAFSAAAGFAAARLSVSGRRSRAG